VVDKKVVDKKVVDKKVVDKKVVDKKVVDKKVVDKKVDEPGADNMVACKINGNKFQCTKCNKIFTNNRNLLTHNNSPTACDRNKKTCIVCCKTYKTNALLKRHYKTNKHLNAVNMHI
jgi:hypothetical protein